MNDAIYKAVEEQFESRIKANNIKKGSAKYKHMQAEFFTGAMAAFIAIISQPTFIKTSDDMGQAMPPKWIFPIMSGDPIVK
jgi:hypothetical protein